jgi:DNA modification methylase
LTKAKADPIRIRIIERRMMKPRDLLDHPGQWRDHPKAQAEAMQGVLRDIGITDSLKAWHSERAGGALVTWDGHLRKGLDPDQEWPVDILDFTDAEADYALLTHDPICAMALADKAALDALLSSVNSGEAAVQAMLAELAAKEGLYLEPKKEAPEPQIDKAEELQAKWGTAVGQVWECGRHRIACGDCTDAAVVQRLFDGQVPNLCVTDPPYGVEYDANWRQEAAEAGHLAYAPMRVRKVRNDGQVNWDEAWRLFHGNVLYCWHAGRHASSTQASIETSGFEVRCQIIWAKSNFPISRGHYHWRHEPCWYAVRKGADASWIGDRKQTTLWEINLDRNVEGGHSTQKPLACMETPIINHAGDVYDPFVGSGTTLVAAERQNRRGFACEIDPAYVAVSLQRLADMDLSPRLCDG